MLVLIVLTFCSGFYKYYILKDFNSVFLVECKESDTNFFQNFDACENEQSLGDCVFSYKAYKINQGSLISCTPDDGSCVIDVCTTTKKCKIIDCLSAIADDLELYDECQS